MAILPYFLNFMLYTLFCIKWLNLPRMVQNSYNMTYYVSKMQKNMKNRVMKIIKIKWLFTNNLISLKNKCIFINIVAYHFKAKIMLSLNIVLFFMFGQPLDPYSVVNRGKIKISKKRPLNKNVILYSFIYHFKAKIMLRLHCKKKKCLRCHYRHLKKNSILMIRIKAS